MSDPVPQTTRPKSMGDHQWEWFELCRKLGDPGARAALVARLRTAADQVERGGYPNVYGCRMWESGPMQGVDVILSMPWGG